MVIKLLLCPKINIIFLFHLTFCDLLFNCFALDDRLHDFTVGVAMEFTAETFESTLTLHKVCAHVAGAVGAGERRLIACQTMHVGQFVFIYLTTAGILTLCEVEVFAVPGKSFV